MKLPLSLIQSFGKIQKTPEEIGEILTLLGIEVDKIYDLDTDPVFELSLTPNLGHCMSALGIARELGIPIAEKTYSVAPGHKKVHVKELCPRYMYLELDHVETDKDKIVDATNDIMLKFGQPLHAFDLDLIEGDITVCKAQADEPYLFLDNVTRTIPKGTLLIRDAKKTLAVAGVMGGANSAISQNTKRVLLEGAYFDPISIRNTAKALDLRTESAQRFEKGVDPNGIARALHEAALLIGGKIKGGIDVAIEDFAPKLVAYRVERVNKLLGAKLSETEIEQIFTRLGFNPKNGIAHVPRYRHDVNHEIDLVEEAARIYGYNNLEKRAPRFSASPLPTDAIFLFENEIRKRLVAQGLTEFLNCDLISPKLYDVAPVAEPLKTLYSKSEEFSVLRVSLLPGLLQSAKNNIDKSSPHIAAFEVGRVHFKDAEIPMAAILLTGDALPAHWSRKSKEVDFFDLKGIVETICEANIQPSEHELFHPGRQADISIDDLKIGSLGEVHPSVTEKLGIEARIFYAEINLEELLEKRKAHKRMKPLAQYPATVRDWTLTLQSKQTIDKVLSAIKTVHAPLLEKVEVIDLYEGKNATLRFTYRDPFKTVAFEEADRTHTQLIEKLIKILAKDNVIL